MVFLGVFLFFFDSSFSFYFHPFIPPSIHPSLADYLSQKKGKKNGASFPHRFLLFIKWWRGGGGEAMSFNDCWIAQEPKDFVPGDDFSVERDATS
jgi:hypothetical protein